jgi:HK97 family phage major capsid protein
VLAEIQAIQDEAGDEPFTDEQKARWNELNDQAEHFRRRRERLMDLASRPENCEAEPEFKPSRPQPAPRHLQQARSEALRAIERADLSDKAARAAEELVDRDVNGPAGGFDAKYLAAVGNPAYARAFGKVLANPQTAHLQMTSEELESLHDANRAHQERAMAEGTTTTGGFAVPIGIDPTIRLSSDGALNPIRELATVRSMTTHEVRLVTSEGVTASFAAEAAEVADNAPTLAQPVLYAEKAHSFVPFSIEIGQDWGASRPTSPACSPTPKTSWRAPCS